MEPNMVDPNEKAIVMKPAWGKVYLVMLIVALLFFIGWLGTNVYVLIETNRFSSLLDQGKYSEAGALYHRAAGFLPQKWLEVPFGRALEVRVDLLAEDYLGNQVKYDAAKSCLEAIDKMGLVPANLQKCQALISAEETSRKSDEHQAVSIIEKALQAYPGDALLTTQLTKYQTRADQLVLYDGPIQHIFFHPLIAYSEMAFDGDRMSRGLNEFMVTVKEFDLILDSLYDKGYMLIDTHNIFEERPNGDKTELVKKELWLPKNKKPLILSIDDLNYYPYMRENGMNHKLVLDKEGNVAAYSVSPDKKEIIASDNEIITIVDKFVEKHPDFSHKGAKGIIALTGFNGVLGYRTDAINVLSFAAEKEQALTVIKRLKDTGWSFASHGYGHIDTGKRSIADLVKDTQKWKLEVESLIGPTDLYIYPYGSSVPTTDPRFIFLQQNGFKVFCGVGPREYLRFYPDSVVMDRRHIDGIAFWQQPETLEDLFRVDDVIDPVRPPL